jgi:hypothetical protein
LKWDIDSHGTKIPGDFFAKVAKGFPKLVSKDSDSEDMTEDEETNEINTDEMEDEEMNEFIDRWLTQSDGYRRLHYKGYMDPDCY